MIPVIVITKKPIKEKLKEQGMLVDKTNLYCIYWGNVKDKNIIENIRNIEEVEHIKEDYQRKMI